MLFKKLVFEKLTSFFDSIFLFIRKDSEKSSTIIGMDEEALKKCLSILPITGIQYYKSVTSTNDVANEWAQTGAEEYSIVIAETQTEGRGRLERRWVTNSGAALAFSLILFPTLEESKKISLFSPLAALAICQAIKMISDKPDIRVKWPNDVLINKQKTAGILTESSWLGNRVQYTIMGIGINISSASIPPASQVLFPATCLEDNLENKLDRLEFLAATIGCIIKWREKLLESIFLDSWNALLAFRNSFVCVEQGSTTIVGKLKRVDADGNLCLLTQNGAEIRVGFGDVHLRPINDLESSQETYHV